MIEDIIYQVEEIFVGRQEEIRQLKALWKNSKKKKEHKVVSLLNFS